MRFAAVDSVTENAFRNYKITEEKQLALIVCDDDNGFGDPPGIL